ncbi:MAG: ImmA/IrrE family metallo-endopeptidase [Gallionella sp.]|nr:ImmA/IrrE family metallo-endopeptidase [Gallionella sp.]
MDKQIIESTARDVHKLIWKQKNQIWPARVPHPFEMLEPEIAAHALGIRYEFHPELILLNRRSSKSEVAGLLDRQAGKIAVADQFPEETIRFTGAHEIGHWLLHPDETMHRDRPIKGLIGGMGDRPTKEKEADYFAACFLMPRKLVIDAFESTFMTQVPFVFDDAAAFWLCPSDPESLLRADHGSLDRALALATAQSYGGRHFNSLAKQFRVSVTTMAIRLNELGLIEE